MSISTPVMTILVSEGAPRPARGSVSLHGRHERFTVAIPEDHEPSKMALRIQKSLNRPKACTVDTLYLHVPDRHTPLEVTAKAMDVAFQQRQFKKFGLSNDSATDVQKIITICEREG
jgi:aflatoxin B1 aldehyde reductase